MEVKSKAGCSKDDIRCCDVGDKLLEELLNDEGEKLMEEDRLSERYTNEETMDVNISNKRVLEAGDTDEEWSRMTSRGKRIRKNKNTPQEIQNNIEVTISCKNKLPKSFALARLFKDENINNVVTVKYLSPYRVRIQFEDEFSANKLCANENFISNGWRLNKDMEVGFSYGTIRNVDLDLSEEDILKQIICSNSMELISVRRLNRRDTRNSEGWEPSESVRLCFRGSSLPPYIYTENIRMTVEPYVFPVSQCSHCWKYGHTKKTCPTNKIICPKCSGNHTNCETTSFLCANCSGKHMALSRTCPVYIKEKRIREIMSEFNCTYKKALIVYVPPETPKTHQHESCHDINMPYMPMNSDDDSPTFADVLKTTAGIPRKEKIVRPQRNYAKQHVNKSQRRQTPAPELRSESHEYTDNNSDAGNGEKAKSTNIN